MDMTRSEKTPNNRMARVIRTAISDHQVLECLSQKDLVNVLEGALSSLSPSDVSGFIYRCLTRGEISKGLVVVDRVIHHAAELLERGDETGAGEIVGAAVGALSILSESLPSVKSKVNDLIFHENPAIVAVVVENLGQSSNVDNFNKVCELLSHGDFRAAMAAAKYVESCTRDAAFRKRREMYLLEDAAEEFLRRALLPLEKTYSKLKKSGDGPHNIQKRLAILVAMIYSEILDSTDWKRFKNEDVEERIYYTLEQHLHEDIGPEALSYLFIMIERPELEEGTKISALHTVGRLSKKERFQKEIISWIEKYILAESSETLVNTARKILEACEHKKPFSVVVEGQNGIFEKSSIVPRAAGAPPKLDKQ
jgi:hypothetical protein